ncbi:MAG: hypothetical protein JNK02_15530 [Planctomycetes bacterium]|nr:hypothetical protein [Planctomycetota bacterium]
MAHLCRAFLSGLALAGASVLAGALLAPESRAHGGSYRGPGASLPPGAAGPSAPSGPATGGPGSGGVNPATGASVASDLTGWPLWWGLNREPYLELRAALERGGAALATGIPAAALPVGRRPSDAQVRERIAPLLVATLRTERNPDIATAALLALAKCGSRLESGARAEAAVALRARLADANQEVSETAALALGLLARTADLGLLGDLLADAPAGREACGRAAVPVRTRAFAAYALGLSAERVANQDSRRWVAQRLLAAVAEPPAASRDVPVAALVALGLVELPSPAMPEAAPAVESPTASAAALYDHVAAWYADARRDPHVRAYAPVSLARLALRAGEARRAGCIRLLAEALETGSSEPPTVRQSAVQALGLVANGGGEAHDARARALLRLASGEGDRLARRFAWIALARVGARPGRDGRDALVESRALLTGLLARGSTPERPWLALALGVGERAARARGVDTPSGVYDALERAVREHTSPTEAGAHLLALALAGAPASGPVLLARLASLSDDEVRAHAALALGLSGVTAAIEPLRRVVPEARYRPTLLREASIALGLLGDTSVTSELVRILEDSRGLTALAAVATALGYVGDRGAVEPLLAIASDAARDASARAFAIVALGLLGDPRPLPWNTPLALDTNWWLPPSTLFEPATGTGVLDLL